jgi:hypothetical protein
VETNAELELKKERQRISDLVGIIETGELKGEAKKTWDEVIDGFKEKMERAVNVGGLTIGAATEGASRVARWIRGRSDQSAKLPAAVEPSRPPKRSSQAQKTQISPPTQPEQARVRVLEERAPQPPPTAPFIGNWYWLIAAPCFLLAAPCACCIRTCASLFGIK